MSSYVDLMPGGCLVVGPARDVRFVNGFFAKQFGYDSQEIVGWTLQRLLTRASRIFYDTYIQPILSHEGACSEVELAFVDANGQRCPVVANLILLSGDDPVVVWCIVGAEKREKSHQELVKARENLSDYAKQLQGLAATDPLTGLSNRREFERCAMRNSISADKADCPIAFVLIDVDHFKSFNDRFGHAIGDEVLRQLGHVLRTAGRKQDTIARYGGEEFICCLYDTDEVGAEAFARRVHIAVEEMHVQTSRVTVSLGITIRAPKGELSFDAVVEQADRALYAAKSAGRNMTVHYSAIGNLPGEAA